MTGWSGHPYDEANLGNRITGLSKRERCLFAAACAERLMPLYVSIVRPGNKADAERVRAALDLVWLAGPSFQAKQAQLEIEELVPDEDDGSQADVALVQNAITAVAYALRVVTSQGSQEVVWVARQLYEAADYIVQRGAPNQSYIEPLEDEAPIQVVLRGLESTFAHLETRSILQLRTQAETDGNILLDLFKS